MFGARDVANDDISHLVGVSNRERFVRNFRLLARPKKNAQGYLSTSPVRGKVAGQGVGGTVVLFGVTPAMQRYLASLARRLTHRVGGMSLPAVGARVAIKVAAFRQHDVHGTRGGSALDVRGMVHEAAVQKYVYGSCVRDVVCGKELVPRVYMTGMDRKYGVFIVVMEAVDGVQLADALKREPLTAKRFARLERALTALWLFGIVHNDAHFENLYIGRDGWPKIIDFGHSVVIPKSRRARSMGDIFRAEFRHGIQRHASRVQARRGYSFSNPDTKALRVLYGRMVDPQNLPAERAKLWPASVLPPAPESGFVSPGGKTVRTKSGRVLGAYVGGIRRPFVHYKTPGGSIKWVKPISNPKA